MKGMDPSLRCSCMVEFRLIRCSSCIGILLEYKQKSKRLAAQAEAERKAAARREEWISTDTLVHDPWVQETGIDPAAAPGTPRHIDRRLGPF